VLQIAEEGKMKRYRLLVGVWCAALTLAGCKPQATKTDQKPSTPAATLPETPAPASKQEVKAEMPADPFATAPASASSLGIPELKPPEIAPPKIENKAGPKPAAKK
jgi:hypothetical protein